MLNIFKTKEQKVEELMTEILIMHDTICDLSEAHDYYTEIHDIESALDVAEKMVKTLKKVRKLQARYRRLKYVKL